MKNYLKQQRKKEKSTHNTNNLKKKSLNTLEKTSQKK